jgi:ABC-type Fe3+-siderophore transport system permease subunit
MMEKKFNTLRIISVVFKVIAWVVAVFTIIGFIGMLVGGAALSQFSNRYGANYFPLGAFGGIAMAFYILILGAVWFISLLAGAELIMVILAIEENTRTEPPKPKRPEE